MGKPKNDYQREVANVQISKRDSDKKYAEEVKKIQEKYKIPPKERLTTKEASTLIARVLETGMNGTKAIREYSIEHKKTKKWVTEVAKPKVSKRAAFGIALQEFKEHPVVLSMIKHDIYNEKDILNNSVTGALTKLSKQIEITSRLDQKASTLASEVKSIANIEAGRNWVEEAVELRSTGMSYGKIAELVGKSKSAVEKYIKINTEKT